MVATEEPKVYLVPEREFTRLVIEAGRRFNTLAPLAPYPSLLGAEWKTNSTIYRWFVKRLKELAEKFEPLVQGLQ